MYSGGSVGVGVGGGGIGNEGGGGLKAPQVLQPFFRPQPNQISPDRKISTD